MLTVNFQVTQPCSLVGG